MGPKTLEEQVADCAEQCGLTHAEVHAGMVGALGDGVLLGKFLDFLKLILPLVLPFVQPKPPTA